MYTLAVTYTFDLEHDRRDAEERSADIIDYLGTLPGFAGAESVSVDHGRLTLISMWSSRQAADQALNGEEVNAELAGRAGPVCQRPDAVGAGF